MNVHKNWSSDISNSESLYMTNDEVITNVKSNFDYRRYYSTEGCSVEIDGIKEQVLIQDYTNPLNQDKQDKKIHVPMDSKLVSGSLINWDNNLWLTESRITTIEGAGAYKSASIFMCNNLLKRIVDGTLIADPCVIDAKVSRYNLDQNTTISLQEAKLTVAVQGNINTRKIAVNDRFLFGGQAFKTIYVDNYQLEDINDKNTAAVIVLYLAIDQVVPNVDDVENNIANGLGKQPTPSPTPTPTTLGTANIANTKNAIYTTSVDIKVGSTGTSAKPFVAIFKDITGNVIQSISSKWSLVLPSALTDKVSLTYNATYPDRCYVTVINDSLLIGQNFELHLIDSNSLYGECIIKCNITSLYG